MTERKKYPRNVNAPDWAINLLAKTGFMLPEQPIGELHNLTGESMQLTADTTHEQLIYQNANTGEILRRPAKKRMLFFHSQIPVTQIDHTKGIFGPNSKKLTLDISEKWKAAGGDLKSIPKDLHPKKR